MGLGQVCLGDKREDGKGPPPTQVAFPSSLHKPQRWIFPEPHSPAWSHPLLTTGLYFWPSAGLEADCFMCKERWPWLLCLPLNKSLSLSSTVFSSLIENFHGSLTPSSASLKVSCRQDGRFSWHGCSSLCKTQLKAKPLGKSCKSLLVDLRVGGLFHVSVQPESQRKKVLTVLVTFPWADVLMTVTVTRIYSMSGLVLTYLI